MRQNVRQVCLSPYYPLSLLTTDHYVDHSFLFKRVATGKARLRVTDVTKFS
jgi:hypothetical protein